MTIYYVTNKEELFKVLKKSKKGDIIWMDDHPEAVYREEEGNIYVKGK